MTEKITNMETIIAPKEITVKFKADRKMSLILEDMKRKFECQSVAFLVRKIIIERARDAGYDVSGIENKKYGRKDLANKDPKALEQSRKKAAYARSKIRRKRNGEPVDADVELSFKLAYEAMDDQRPRKKKQGEKS